MAWDDRYTDEQFRALRRLWKRLNYDYTEADLPKTRREARDLVHELLGKVRQLQSKR